MDAPGDVSRSFKRRQRRKKQQERRRLTEPGASSDEVEPAGAGAEGAETAPTAAEGGVTADGEVERSQAEKGRAAEEKRPPASAKSAGAAAKETEKGAAKGKAKSLKSEGEVGGESARKAESRAEGPNNEENKVTPRDSNSQMEAAPDGSEKVASSGTSGKSKSGSAKRRKRKSAIAADAPADKQSTASAAPGRPSESKEDGVKTAPGAGVHEASPPESSASPPISNASGPRPAGVTSPPTSERSPPPAGESSASVPAAGEAAVCESAAPPPARLRRETSPVVSSTEEVLRSIRSLQAVLGELRSGLLAEPRRAEPSPGKTSPAEPGPAKPAAQSPAKPSAAAAAAAAASASAAATLCAEPAAAAMAPPPGQGAAETAAAADDQAGQQKSKEQIKAERKAKAEAAKLAKAAKASQKKQQQAAAAAAGGDGSGAAPQTPQGSAPPPQKATDRQQEKPAGGSQSAGGPQQQSAGGSTEGPAGGPQKPDGQPQEKSKAQLKAERREKQEAQRAAKAAAAAAASAAKSGDTAAKGAAQSKAAKATEAPPASGHDEDVSKADKKGAKKTVGQAAVKKGVQMFSHLPQFDASAVDSFTAKSNVHPAILRLGLRLARGRVTGSNAGAVALLTALDQLVEAYKTPPQGELRRDLHDQVRRAVGLVAECRPLSVAMENVAARLEKFIRDSVQPDMSEHEAKTNLREWIERFIEDHICKAMTAITNFAGDKIKNDDTILTYGRSSAVLDALRSAHKNGLKFRAVVVDSRPSLEGRHMLRELLDVGVPCTYGMISAVSHHMREATKVLLGAHALLSNGMVLSRAGSALVSLTGRAFNRPVLVCCETYKFSERVQIDSQVYNQLGDPDELVPSADSPLAGWRQSESLSLLNLTYDVTPPELVDVVITELGAIPCTSVPAVLRLHQRAAY